MKALRRRAWMIVLGIVVVLMIVVPIVVGGEARDQDQRAQQLLRRALAVAEDLAARSGGEFETDPAANTPIQPADLQREEPSVRFAVQGDLNVVGVYVENSNRSITLFTQSESGKWFGIVGFTEGEDAYCSSSGPRGVDDSVQCQDSTW